MISIIKELGFEGTRIMISIIRDGLCIMVIRIMITNMIINTVFLNENYFYVRRYTVESTETRVQIVMCIFGF